MKGLFSRRNAWMLAAVLVILGVGCAFGLSRGQKTMLAKLPAMRQNAERDSLLITAQATEDMRTLKGNMQLTTTNRTGGELTELVFRLYANGVREGSMVISGVTIDGKETSFAPDADDPSVLRVPYALKSGDTVDVAFRFALTVPRGESEIARTDDSALLIGALPMPAMWENGAWRTDAYDALAETSYAQPVDIQMALTVPEKVKAAFGGAWTAEQQNGDGTKTLTMQLEGARDISLAMRAGGSMRQAMSGDILVTALAENSRTAARLLEAACKALEAVESVGLAYPFPSLTVVQAQSGHEDGTIGTALLAVDGMKKGDALLQQLTRLCARQIFGVQVENDPWNAPWLSQTLASCVELLAYRGREGDAAYEKRFYSEVEVAMRLTRPHGVNVGASTEHFGDDSEMTQVLRDQGAASLMGIDTAVGGEAFIRALQIYADENAGGTASLEKLESALEQATGSAWDGYLSDMLAF